MIGRMTSRVKAIAFDLDDTLAPSKAAISSETSAMLSDLLTEYDVCVISGGTYRQFVDQLIAHLVEPADWSQAPPDADERCEPLRLVGQASGPRFMPRS